MGVNVENILLEAIGQEGDRYVWGGKGDPLDPDPDGFDCSGLVTWACERAGVDMANGAFWQYKTCANAGTLVDVDTALATRGALLFVKRNAHPVAFDDVPHVAISLGDGTTVEARGTKWGIGTWAGAGRFQEGGLIPGADYGEAPPFPIADPPAPSSSDAPEWPGRVLEVTRPFMAGDDIAVWQQRMIDRGWDLGPDGADGKYGPKTASVAEAFQREKGLEVDGKVGPETWGAAWTAPVT